MEQNILLVISFLITCAGICVFIKSSAIGEKIKTFYSNYPLVRLAGKKQLTSRPTFIKIIGIVIVFVGLICFFSIFKK